MRDTKVVGSSLAKAFAMPSNRGQTTRCPKGRVRSGPWSSDKCAARFRTRAPTGSSRRLAKDITTISTPRKEISAAIVASTMALPPRCPR